MCATWIVNVEMIGYWYVNVAVIDFLFCVLIFFKKKYQN